MGTNYYIEAGVVGTERFHIGKLSARIPFQLRIYPDSYSDLHDWLPLLFTCSENIIDEYDNKIPLERLLGLIVRGAPGWDIKWQTCDYDFS